MKAGDLINLLMSYNESDEVQIEIYETVSSQYFDTTAAISVVGDGSFAPTLRIDVETGKFKYFP